MVYNKLIYKLTRPIYIANVCFRHLHLSLQPGCLTSHVISLFLPKKSGYAFLDSLVYWSQNSFVALSKTPIQISGEQSKYRFISTSLF